MGREKEVEGLIEIKEKEPALPSPVPFLRFKTFRSIPIHYSRSFCPVNGIPGKKNSPQDLPRRPFFFIIVKDNEKWYILMISEVSLPVNAGDRKRTGRIRFLFLLQQMTKADHMSFGTMILPQLVRICKRVSFH